MNTRPAIAGGKPVRDSFLIFGSPLIEEAEIQEVEKTLRSGWLGSGPKVSKFEEMFKDYVGSKHAIALNSCTAGLHLSLLVAGIGPGDEVITTPMSFAATANVIIHAGAKPVFSDIERNTMNMDPNRLEDKVKKLEAQGSKLRAILPVHLAGRPCDMDAIMEIARKYDLIIIEDAAHALGAEYKGRKIGSIGDLNCFSFYVTKNIVTGEGGMVTTENDEWADNIQIYALHGMSKGAWKRYTDEGFKHYQIVYPGYKYNMMDIQASIGIHQLPRIEKYLRRREEIWQRYDNAFSHLPVIIPAPVDKNTRHARHLYTLLLDIEALKVDRDAVQQALYEENIGTGIHFLALHLHAYYSRTYGYKRGDFPNAEFISDRTMSLPLSAKLTDQDIDDVVEATVKVINFYKK